MGETGSAAVKKREVLRLSGTYSNWVVDFFFTLYQKAASNLQRVTGIIKYVFQALGLVIAIWSGLFVFAIIGVHGLENYFQTLAVGLSFRANSLLFYNGVVAVVMTLTCIYGILSALSFNKSLYVMDIALLYFIIFQFFAIHQLPILVNGGLIIAIWIIHRLLLGSIAVFHKKDKQLGNSLSDKEN